MADPERMRKVLVALRLTVGLVALAAPRTTARLFGIDPAANRALPLLTRVFAIRDALMAYQLYQAADDELEEVLRQGILVDGVDVLTAVGCLVRGEISARTFVLVAAAGAGGIGAGLAARRP